MVRNKDSLLTYLQHITSHHITSHHIISHHITSYHITSHHITSHHITSHHITSHHITLLHIALNHITSHHMDEFIPELRSYFSTCLTSSPFWSILHLNFESKLIERLSSTARLECCQFHWTEIASCSQPQRHCESDRCQQISAIVG